MADLPAISGKEAVKAFEKAGFTVVRVTGSHHIMKRGDVPYLINIPVHGSKSIHTGLLKRQIRLAGMTVDEFRELL